MLSQGGGKLVTRQMAKSVVSWKWRDALRHGLRHPLARVGSSSPRLWECIIGLEIHAQISSQSKLFSEASADFSSGVDRPNEQVALFDAGVPGTLPSVNKFCVEQAVKTGLALGGSIRDRSVFDRKHYFYADMPLGYQITQQRLPLVEGGRLVVQIPTNQQSGGAELAREVGGGGRGGGSDGQEGAKGKKKSKKKSKKERGASAADDTFAFEREVRLRQLQVEQDSGKSLYATIRGAAGSGSAPRRQTLVDLNRAGVALMEIVTEPELRSPAETGAFVRKLQLLLRYLGTCDGNMEDGSLRCDLNVNIRSWGVEGNQDGGEDWERGGGGGRGRGGEGEACASYKPPRVEVKNVNSVRHLMRAVDFEVARHAARVEAAEEEGGEAAVRALLSSWKPETRLFDASLPGGGETRPMRTKEEAGRF